MDPVLVQVVGAVITTLLLAIAGLWRENGKWQRLYRNEQQKRIEDLKEHGRSSEMFLNALKKQRRVSSAPPPSR